MTDKSKIFAILCEHCCNIMDGWVPYPSTVMHSHFPHLSLYKVRKYLNALRQEGLVDTELWVESGEEHPILVRGWVVTKEGRNTAEFEMAHQDERRRCLECFGFDIGESFIDLNEVEEIF